LAKLQRLTAGEAESLLFQNGFVLTRTKGSHRIYMKGHSRVVVPFHGNKILHPKIVKQVLQSFES